MLVHLHSRLLSDSESCAWTLEFIRRDFWGSNPLWAKEKTHLLFIFGSPQRTIAHCISVSQNIWFIVRANCWYITFPSLKPLMVRSSSSKRVWHAKFYFADGQATHSACCLTVCLCAYGTDFIVWEFDGWNPLRAQKNVSAIWVVSCCQCIKVICGLRWSAPQYSDDLTIQPILQFKRGLWKPPATFVI